MEIFDRSGEISPTKFLSDKILFDRVWSNISKILASLMTSLTRVLLWINQYILALGKHILQECFANIKCGLLATN